MAHEDHDHKHECGCDPDDPCCDHDEIEVVELEDENGEKEEFAILDEVDFEDRHFCIMAPLAEVQAFEDSEGDESAEPDLSIEIFEVKGEDFTSLEDEALAQRLMEHLDEVSRQLEEEEKQ